MFRVLLVLLLLLPAVVVATIPALATVAVVSSKLAVRQDNRVEEHRSQKLATFGKLGDVRQPENSGNF